MSLTNPNTVVTEERLNDFYKGILPYLGGMPEMLANKFSKGDLYSTDEKMIGQWIDGKPLYQKVFSVVDTGNSSTHTITIPSTLNIESVVYFKAEKVCEGYGISIPYTESNHVITVSKPVTSGDIVFTKDTATVWSGTYYLTMKYTKTTDSAISIGNDTDYSTEEKIIGTWVSGKPLYQKTIIKTISSTQAIPSTGLYQGAIDLSADIPNIEMAFVDVQHAYYLVSTGGSRGFVCAWYELDTSLLWFSTIFSRTNVEGHFTIQYTKTT